MKKAKKVRDQSHLLTPWKTGEVALVVALSLIVPFTLVILLGIGSHYVTELARAYSFLMNATPLSQSVFYLLGVVIELGLLAVVASKYSVGLSAFGIRKFKILQALRLVAFFYFALLAAIAVIFTLVSIFVPSVDVNATQVTGFEGASHLWEKMLGFVIIVLAAPIVEEIFYRGFVFAGLSRSLKPFGAALVSSVLFGLLHFQANVGIYTFVLALFLCVLYYRCKSIVPGIMLHMINNFIAYLVLFKII